MENDIIHDIEVLDETPPPEQQCPCPVIRQLLEDGKITADDSDGLDERFRNFKLSDWIDGQDVKVAFNISQKTLQNMRNKGRLPYSKFGGKIMYYLKDIRSMLAENYVERRNQEHGDTDGS